MDMEQLHRKERAQGTQFGVGMLIGFSLVALTFFGITRAPLLVERVPALAAVISSVLIELTNNDRSSSGLATLTINETLTAVAQAKANDMAEKSYFAHTSPEGLTPWHWFKEKGYQFAYAGENLAVDFSESADVERAWMNSPTHRANVLGTQFTEIGIGVAQGSYQGRPTTFVVQVFGTPAPQALAPKAPKPATPAVAGTTTPPVVVDEVRDLTLDPGPELPALATTLPTTTVAAQTSEAILGQSAGAYLARSAEVPWWFKWVSYLGFD